MENRRNDVPSYLKSYFNEASQFYYYQEHKKNVRFSRKIDEKFICLKGFASSTPIVNSASFDSNLMGGGFYFRVNGVGIVIDPGIGFVTLMHRNGIFIDDVDVVVVTHSHIDHNSDVPALSSLLYDYNNSHDREHKHYSRYLGCSEYVPHEIKWYLDENTKKNNADILEKQKVVALGEVADKKYKSILNEKIALSALRTQHDRANQDTYGLKFEFKGNNQNIVWGYTSDTTYFEELPQFFMDSDVLIMNLSDIYISDVVNGKQKKSHLGFTGCSQLISSVQPKVALVTEFCCTKGDYRFDIVRGLEERIASNSIRIIPADIGLKMSIDAVHFECTICKADGLLQGIKTMRPSQEFGKMHYVCPDCLL